MIYEITGVICQVSEVKQITPTFRTRGFVLDISYEYQDMIITGYAVLQAVNAVCDFLEDQATADTVRFIVGDRVKVHFKLKGTQNKTNGSVYNNLSVFRIEAAEQEFTPYVAPAPAVTPTQQVQSFQAQQPAPPPEIIDDLPF